MFLRQTILFINNKIVYRLSQDKSKKIDESDLEKMDQSELYITFKEFKEWLDQYKFVRNMIREALMPKLWGLSDQSGSETIRTYYKFNKSNKK